MLEEHAGEIWRVVPNFPEYEVSDHGRVRSLYYRGHLRKPPRVLKPVVQNGYSRIYLRQYEKGKSKGKATSYAVHRLMKITFDPLSPEEMASLQCAHLDGKRNNNRLENIVWATRKENDDHKILHGTKKFGPDTNMAKLCESGVRAMRILYSMGWTQSQLSALFNLNSGGTSRLLRNVSYQNVAQDVVLPDGRWPLDRSKNMQKLLAVSQHQSGGGG